MHRLSLPASQIPCRRKQRGKMIGLDYPTELGASKHSSGRCMYACVSNPIHKNLNRPHIDRLLVDARVGIIFRHVTRRHQIWGSAALPASTTRRHSPSVLKELVNGILQISLGAAFNKERCHGSEAWDAPHEWREPRCLCSHTAPPRQRPAPCDLTPLSILERVSIKNMGMARTFRGKRPHQWCSRPSRRQTEQQKQRRQTCRKPTNKPE